MPPRGLGVRRALDPEEEVSPAAEREEGLEILMHEDHLMFFLLGDRMFPLLLFQQPPVQSLRRGRIAALMDEVTGGACALYRGEPELIRELVLEGSSVRSAYGAGAVNE